MSRQIAQPLGHYELATDEALALSAGANPCRRSLAGRMRRCVTERSAGQLSVSARWLALSMSAACLFPVAMAVSKPDPISKATWTGIERGYANPSFCLLEDSSP